MTVMYPERAGSRAAPAGRLDTSGGAAPPALTIGSRVWVHTASCESPSQHERVALAGVIVEVYDDGAALARMDDGSSFELCPWFTSACPNDAACAAEEAAAMKALTLTQPWATLVSLGAKRIETRSWSTNYRGPLAIHAAKGFPGPAREICYDQPFLDVLTAARIGPATFPLGKIVATCRLVVVLPIEGLSPSQLQEQERAFGDYTPGRYAWLLDDIEPLHKPVLAKGALGLWEWRAAA